MIKIPIPEASSVNDFLKPYPYSVKKCPRCQSSTALKEEIVPTGREGKWLVACWRCGHEYEIASGDIVTRLCWVKDGIEQEKFVFDKSVDERVWIEELGKWV